MCFTKGNLKRPIYRNTTGYRDIFSVKKVNATCQILVYINVIDYYLLDNVNCRHMFDDVWKSSMSM